MSEGQSVRRGRKGCINKEVYSVRVKTRTESGAQIS